MRMRKGLAVIAAVVMTAMMSLGSSLAATSVGISDGATAVTVNQTTVGFGGHEWWVIGDTKGGVYSEADSVTLLAKDDFGNTEFRKISAIEQEGYKQYGIYWYEGTFKDFPNEYKDSTLQRKMESIANNFSDKEKGKINDRTITSEGESHPILGADVANQKVWALSGDEYLSIRSENVRSYGKDNWLRSFSRYLDALAWFAPAAGHPTINDRDVSINMAARPALNLNLTSVILTSNSGVASGKVSATPGGSLVSVTYPVTTGTSNKIKYTFEDDKLKLGDVSVSKIEGNKVTVAYDGATAGKTLSVIGKEKGGLVKFYGKLSSSTSASGVGSFEVPDNFDFSKYDLEVFVEEIGGENESDFASTPQALDLSKLKEVTVINGSGSAKYAEGEEVTLTANPPAEGKYFWGWSITPQVTLAEGTLSSGIIKLKMPGENVTATAVYEDIPSVVYPIKDGGSSTWTQDDKGGLTITSEGEHRKFTGVTVDGNTVASQHYTVESGSTIVTLKASYLSTLSVGEHVLRIHFTDGYTETKFSIQEVQTDKPAPPTTDPGEPTPPVNPPVQPGEPNPPVEQGGTTANITETTVAPVGTSPKTSDSSRIWIMVSLMLGAGVGFMVINVMKKGKQI